MSIKKYKNIYYALVLYIIALFIAYFPSGNIFPDLFGQFLFYFAILMVFIGIFFGFRSIKANESWWAGYFMVIIGGLVLISPVVIYVIAVTFSL